MSPTQWPFVNLLIECHCQIDQTEMIYKTNPREWYSSYYTRILPLHMPSELIENMPPLISATEFNRMIDRYFSVFRLILSVVLLFFRSKYPESIKKPAFGHWKETPSLSRSVSTSRYSLLYTRLLSSYRWNCNTFSSRTNSPSKDSGYPEWHSSDIPAR